MSRPFVSFCIKAYNAENCVSQAIDSVLNQTEKNIELILLDNASTDNTGLIFKEYAKKDRRIRVLRNEKNTYFCPDYQEKWIEPQGEYYSVVDADDYIKPEFTRIMYDAAKSCDAEIVVGGAEIFCLDDLTVSYKRIPPAIATENKDVISDNFEKLYNSLRTLWGKLFKTDFYVLNGLYAWQKPQWYQNSGDTLGVLRYLSRCDRFVSVDKPLYCYRYHPGSYYSSRFDICRLRECKYLFEENAKLFKSWNTFDNNNKALLYRIHFGSITDFVAMSIKAENVPKCDRLEFLQSITSDDLFCKYALTKANRNFTFSKINDALGTILKDLSLYDAAVSMRYYVARLYFAYDEEKSGIHSSWCTALILSALCDRQNKYIWGKNLLGRAELPGIAKLLDLKEQEFNIMIKSPHVMRYIINADYKTALGQASGNNMLLSITFKLCDQFLKDSDLDCRLNKQRISKLVGEGKYKEAFPLLLSLLNGRPLDRDGLYFLIYVFWQLNEKRFAIEAAMISTAFWDDDPNILALCGDTMFLAGDAAYSESLYNKAVESGADDGLKADIRRRIAAIKTNRKGRDI